MNTCQKVLLINELESRLGWLIRAYVKRGVTEDNVLIDSVHFTSISFDNGHPRHNTGVLDKAHLHNVVSVIEKTSELIPQHFSVSYSFSRERLLVAATLPDLDTIDFDAPMQLLEYFDEEGIRHAFSQHEADFLSLTNTTAVDWGIVD